MTTGRRAWQTPTGGMLWELWQRQRRLFISQALALVAFALAAPWGRRSTDFNEGLLNPFGIQAGVLGLVQVLSCFCYMEVDARRLQGGMPGHLLLKPLTTTRLVAVPMVCGGTAVVVSFLAWYELVFRYIGFPANHVAWTCAVLLSFTWCIQAVAWSSVNFPWIVQTLFVLSTGVAHLLMALLLAGEKVIGRGGKLGLILALLVGAFLLARAGVQRIREGSWEGGQAAVRKERPGSRQTRRKFSSAFRSQLWLEWRRQGMVLPLFTGVGILFIILMAAAVQVAFKVKTGEAYDGDLQPYLFLIVSTPIVCSLLMGNTIVRFDPSQSGSEMPVFVAVRPMSNGGFVLAKLAMTALTSTVTWFVVMAGILAWLIVCGEAPAVWHAVWAKPTAILVLLVPFFVGCVLFTWRNLVSGIWLALTVRPGVVLIVNYLRYPGYFGIGMLAFRMHDHPEFRAAVVQCLPWILAAFLVGKLVISAAALRWGLRRKTVTGRAIKWIIGGWLACAFFVAVMTNRLCHDLHAPQAWAWSALAGLCLLPLADIALAPVALAWNRHR